MIEGKFGSRRQLSFWLLGQWMTEDDGDQYYQLTHNDESAGFGFDEIYHLRGHDLRNGNSFKPLSRLCHDLGIPLGVQRYQKLSAAHGSKVPGISQLRRVYPRQHVKGSSKRFKNAALIWTRSSKRLCFAMGRATYRTGNRTVTRC